MSEFLLVLAAIVVGASGLATIVMLVIFFCTLLFGGRDCPPIVITNEPPNPATERGSSHRSRE